MLLFRLMPSAPSLKRAALLLGLGLAAVTPAFADDLTFNLAWSGAALGNTAAATGTITIDDSQLNNPGYNNTNNSSNAFVKALNITVTGAGAGDGKFSLSDFAFEVLDTHGGTLNLTKPLIGQPTSGAAFGTTHDNSSGDFNVFRSGASPNAPTGTFYFQLTTGGGSNDPMYLTEFQPIGLPPPPPPPPFVITFDNLPTQQPQNSIVSLTEANGGSSTINGVTFSSNADVLGDQNPLVFAKPHSGHFFFTPSAQAVTTLTTTKLLTGLWLGLDEIGGVSGATSVTVSAMSGSTVLASDSESLTSTTMFYMDTSNFSALTGITGYTLTSHPGPDGSIPYDYAADDFMFGLPAAVPEASTTVSFGLLLALGFGGVMAARRKKADAKA